MSRHVAGLVALGAAAVAASGCMAAAPGTGVATPAAPGQQGESRLPSLLQQLQKNTGNVELFDSPSSQVLAERDQQGKFTTDVTVTPSPSSSKTPTSIALTNPTATRTPTPRPSTGSGGAAAVTSTPTPAPSATATGTATATPTAAPTPTPVPTVPSGAPPTEGGSAGGGATPPTEH